MAGARRSRCSSKLRNWNSIPIDFEEEFRPGVIDFGPDLRQTDAAAHFGRAQLVEEQHGKHKSD